MAKSKKISSKVGLNKALSQARKTGEKLSKGLALGGKRARKSPRGQKTLGFLISG